MAFNVRIYGHRGMEQILVDKPRQFTGDTVFQLAQPYEFAQIVVVNGATPAESLPEQDFNAQSAVTVLLVQVPDGETIRYEINTPSRNVDAGNLSPQLSGIQYFYFREGWTISMVDAASFP